MSTPETVSHLTTLQQKLQRIVDAVVADKQNGVPALTFGTLFRDKETGEWQRVWASAGQLPLLQDNVKVDLTPDTVLATFSLAKLVTAIAVMQLVERGELDLDESVADILPDLIANGVMTADGGRAPIKGGVSVRQLLTHTAGCSYGVISPELHEWHAKQSDEFKKEKPLSFDHFSFPLIRQPGTAWEYGCGYDWLGRLIARKTKLSLEAYVKANIAHPLGVEFDFEQKDVPIPQWGVFQPDSPEIQWLGVFEQVSTGLESCGGAGGVTSMRAYLEIASTLANGGVGVSTGKRVLKEETVLQMFKDELSELGIEYPDQLKAMVPMLILDNDKFPVRHDTGVKKTFSIAGEVNLEPLKNGRVPGTVTWGGIAGLYWTLDPSTGTFCVQGSQIVPFQHPRSLDPFLACEHEVLLSLA